MTEQEILNQIIITAPDEPPFSDAVHMLNSVIIAAESVTEYEALHRFHGLYIGFPADNWAVGEGSGAYAF